MSYTGKYECYITGINGDGSVYLSTTDHYPGDPNFAGTFGELRVHPGQYADK